MVYFKYDLHFYNHEIWKQEGYFIYLSSQLSLGLKLQKKKKVTVEGNNGVHFKWPFTFHLNKTINGNYSHTDSQCVTVPDSHFGPFLLIGWPQDPFYLRESLLDLLNRICINSTSYCLIIDPIGTTNYIFFLSKTSPLLGIFWNSNLNT